MSEVRLKRRQPENVNRKHRSSLGFQERVALSITSLIGTMYAVYFFVLALAGWMLWQGVLSHHPFDPYPFAFLLFMGNIVQLLLMPLIMVGQNIQGKHARLRSEEEYETTVGSYRDLEQILSQLDEQKALLQSLSQKISGSQRS